VLTGNAILLAAPTCGAELDQAPWLGHDGLGQQAVVSDGELGAAALPVLSGQGEWAAGLDTTKPSPVWRPSRLRTTSAAIARSLTAARTVQAPIR